MLKQCTKCREVKAYEFFYKHSRGKEGLASRCKVCVKGYAKKHFQLNKDKYYQNTKNFKSNCTPGVYIIHANNGTYIGESKQIEYRIQEHNVKDNILSPVDKVISYEILEVVKDPILRKEREAYWIKKLNPSLNIQLSS